MQFKRLQFGRHKQAGKILDDWLNGSVDAARSATEKQKTVLSRVLYAVFKGIEAKPHDPNYADELGRQTALAELAALSERMRLLDMIVQAAPILGLLGTVVGMIDAF